jgi:hypothetical protein
MLKALQIQLVTGPSDLLVGPCMRKHMDYDCSLQAAIVDQHWAIGGVCRGDHQPELPGNLQRTNVIERMPRSPGCVLRPGGLALATAIYQPADTPEPHYAY